MLGRVEVAGIAAGGLLVAVGGVLPVGARTDAAVPGIIGDIVVRAAFVGRNGDVGGVLGATAAALVGRDHAVGIAGAYRFRRVDKTGASLARDRPARPFVGDRIIRGHIQPGGAAILGSNIDIIGVGNDADLDRRLVVLEDLFDKIARRFLQRRDLA